MISSLNHSASSEPDSALPIRNPLRALVPGSVIDVEIALDPKTGNLGVKFNDFFYSANITEGKVGEILKVVLQAKADQVLLKLLDGKQAPVPSQARDLQNILSKETPLNIDDRKLLRDTLASSPAFRTYHPIDLPLDPDMIYSPKNVPASREKRESYCCATS